MEEDDGRKISSWRFEYSDEIGDGNDGMMMIMMMVMKKNKNNNNKNNTSVQTNTKWINYI